LRSLEPNALTVVRSESNGLVVAGPGAGKTELLAQRACYLLQTGECKTPRQILAISFKTDAAANLRERVRRRCGENLAKRFHSFTFDAFAKSLVDRFRRALPSEYRPTADYVINFDIQRRTRDLLSGLVGDPAWLTTEGLSTIGGDRFYKRDFIGRALPIPTVGSRSLEDRAAAGLWNSLLFGSPQSQLDFGMIGRLAELLVRGNPLLLKALRQTYSHVFLDEFQDTNRIQYALTSVLFQGSGAVLTAVGDSKQRIMGFAGALEGIFQLYRNDFEAEVYDLVMNYRSAPRLVRIQETLAAAIEPGAAAPRAADDGADGEGECRVLLYPNHDREAAHLAEMAAVWVKDDRVHPRDICVLTRNKPAEYTDALMREFAARGVKARVETDLQDLLVEPLVLVAMDVLALAIHGRHGAAWTALVSLLSGVRGMDDNDPRVRRVERELKAICTTIGAALSSAGCDLQRLRTQLARFFEFLGLEAFRRLYPQYLQDAYFNARFQGFSEYLWKCYQETRTWAQALADFTGEDTVPIITVHKSKGLEYHTVVFIGLEDLAFWNFASQSEEEMRTFFVAFSRAKKRVIFTFCANRARSRRQPEPQARNSIGVLYDLLAAAGVEPEDIA